MRRLEGAMNLAVFEDIRDISPRQGWVPPALVSAWLSDTLNRRYGAVTLVREGGTIQPEGQRLREARHVDGADARDPVVPRLDEPRLHPIQTRSQRRRDPEADRGGRGGDRKDRRARPTTKRPTTRPMRTRTSARSACCSGATGIASSPPGSRAQEDRQAAVRDAYNRAFRGIIIPTYDGGTLDIARWNEAGPQLKAHQIAGILRVLDMRGGLIAFDVGVGKTYTAIGVIAAARQEGWVHRPVVLVPSSLVWKWHDDFLCVLPDYRVLVIGSNRKRISRGKRKGLHHLRDRHARGARREVERLPGRPLRRGDPELRRARRTKMNQEALLEYVKTVESLQRQVKLRQRNAAKKKAEDLSERDRAILKHGVRAFVEEMLELPGRPQVRPRHRLGRHRHRHADRRRGRGF
jgi:hypothetical protein